MHKPERKMGKDPAASCQRRPLHTGRKSGRGFGSPSGGGCWSQDTPVGRSPGGLLRAVKCTAGESSKDIFNGQGDEHFGDSKDAGNKEGALDLTALDDQGRTWDLSRPDCRKRALYLVRATKPRILVGSSLAAATRWNDDGHSSGRGDDPDADAEARRRAEVHLQFCCVLYLEQIERGDVFVHEDLAGAPSWREKVIARVRDAPGVQRVVGHTCAFGTWQTDDKGPGLIKRAMGFMTNSPRIALRLGTRCDRTHRHTGGAMQIAMRSKELRTAMYEGLEEEQEDDRRRKARRFTKDGVRRRIKGTVEEAIRHGGARDTMRQLGDLMHHTGGIDHMQPTRMTTMPRRRRSRRSPGGAASEDLLSFQQGGFWDDNKGGWLSPELVRKALAEEMAYVRWHDVYQRVPRSQCFSDTGKAPIRTGWADTSKGTGDMPNVRSRWVAKEFRTHASPELFAPTSPLEGVKLVISKAASTGSSDTVLLIVDVWRAYFYAPAKRRVYIELPEEDYQHGDEEKCGKLNVSLYGTRDAASNWEAELGGFLEGIGFKKGRGSSCLLNGVAMDASGAVHGDDCIIEAPRKQAETILRRFKDKYEVKHQMIGQHYDLDKTAQILNRTLTWTEDGIRIEADPRHAKEIISAMGVERGNGVSSPMAADRGDKAEDHRGDKAEGKEGERGGEALDKEASTRFRAVAARCNYLSHDRPDLRVATMRACSAMARPTEADWEKLKRIARYLLSVPRVSLLYKWQGPGAKINCYSDSDWAGDRISRRSVSGGAVYHGCHLLKTWAKQQCVVATSSAEAELYASSKASSEYI